MSQTKFADDVKKVLPTLEQARLGLWSMKAAIAINNALNYMVYSTPMKRSYWSYDFSRLSRIEKAFEREGKLHNLVLMGESFDVGIALDGEVVLYQKDPARKYYNGLQSYVRTHNIKLRLADAVETLAQSFFGDGELEALKLAVSCKADTETFLPAAVQGLAESHLERIDVSKNELRVLADLLRGRSQKTAREQHPAEAEAIIGKPGQADPFIANGILALIDACKELERAHESEATAVKNAASKEIADLYNEIEQKRKQLAEKQGELDRKFALDMSKKHKDIEDFLKNLSGNDMHVAF